MHSSEIRERFLKFFKKRGHTVIPSASLITSDEKGITNPTLFNTAGMQPLIPYLLGQPYLIDGHETKRLANAQKCLRMVDIDDVGDKTHATFFEMLGNWSLGDYFKKEAIEWSYEFITSKEEGLGLDPSRLYVTVFEGDENASKDMGVFEIWRKYIPENHIYFMGAKSNWWEAGENGPCGPDTEMFYDVSNTYGGKGLMKEQFIEADAKREVVEIWNDVFLQYEKKNNKIIGKLSKPSVDTGAGLERLAMVMQGVDNIYDTDLLKPVMERINQDSTGGLVKEKRIVADHIRSTVFLIVDGVIPSNTDRGYILRRLLRRAVRYSQIIDFGSHLFELVDYISQTYINIYPEIQKKKNSIREEINKEIDRFNKTIGIGIKEFNKLSEKDISGVSAFMLFSSYGLPIDMIIELAQSKGLNVDVKEFEDEFKKHQELSRAGAEKKFKGGLADVNDEMVVRYHTATHLLHQALHDVLGENVVQKGSNITPERLRFDFTHGTKMTDEEKKKVEEIVNEKISAALSVNKIIMPRDEAEKTGAKHSFGEKYGDEISIYYIGESLEKAYSKEFCGGPHISNTKELAGPEGKWTFKIVREEAVARGIRRIKAVFN
ncbi:MAG: alanine--tRNA ligase [Patescibacteria group bacterium]